MSPCPFPHLLSPALVLRVVWEIGLLVRDCKVLVAGADGLITHLGLFPICSRQSLVLRAVWESDRLVEFAVSPLGERAFSQKVMSFKSAL